MAEENASEEEAVVEASGTDVPEANEPAAEAEAPAAEPEAEAPVAEPEAEVPAAEPEAEPAPPAPAKKRRSLKHVPRTARRTRTKLVREQPATRKPITRTG